MNHDSVMFLIRGIFFKVCSNCAVFCFIRPKEQLSILYAARL